MVKNQQVKLNYLVFKKKGKITGDKLIKKGLHYVEKMKELTEPQVKIIKEKLIKFKNELIKKNRIKKDNSWYYGGIIFNGIKDMKMKIKISKILDICLMKIKMKMKIK